MSATRFFADSRVFHKVGRADRLFTMYQRAALRQGIQAKPNGPSKQRFRLGRGKFPTLTRSCAV